MSIRLYSLFKPSFTNQHQGVLWYTSDGDWTTDPTMRRIFTHKEREKFDSTVLSGAKWRKEGYFNNVKGDRNGDGKLGG